MKSRRFLLSLLAFSVAAGPAAAHEITDTISAMLDTHPQMMIDLTGKSGEYCMNTWTVGGAHMTHYATEPGKTREDMIDFMRLDIADETFVKALDVDALPRMPSKLGAMEPNQWYYLAAGEFDPHHQATFPFAMLVRAHNIVR